jgi:hypothetical protein
MNNMDNQREHGLRCSEGTNSATHEGLGQIRSMEYAKNLTANNNLEDIIPVGDRIVVALKAWPAQYKNLYARELHGDQRSAVCY